MFGIAVGSSFPSDNTNSDLMTDFIFGGEVTTQWSENGGGYSHLLQLSLLTRLGVCC
ncbi:hypothetical protein O9992_02600 [Vibrio lentus]|nr:hypothetical protein [Vibrio lentus]